MCEVGCGEGHGDQPQVRENQVEQEDVPGIGVQEERGEEECYRQDGLRARQLALPSPFNK